MNLPRFCQIFAVFWQDLPCLCCWVQSWTTFSIFAPGPAIRPLLPGSCYIPRPIKKHGLENRRVMFNLTHFLPIERRHFWAADLLTLSSVRPAKSALVSSNILLLLRKCKWKHLPSMNGSYRAISSNKGSKIITKIRNARNVRGTRKVRKETRMAATAALSAQQRQQQNHISIYGVVEDTLLSLMSGLYLWVLGSIFPLIFWEKCLADPSWRFYVSLTTSLALSDLNRLFKYLAEFQSNVI